MKIQLSKKQIERILWWYDVCETESQVREEDEEVYEYLRKKMEGR